MSQFTYRHEALAVALQPNRTLFAPANSTRLGLVFANPSGGSFYVFNGPGSTLSGIIAFFNGTGTLILPYRDWGDIIRQPIHVGHTAGGTVVYCIDYYRTQTGD